MSGMPTTPDQMELQEQIARITRMNAETGKLQEETRKFVSEAHKFAAEARKLNRDHGLAPWLVLVGVVGGLLGMVSFAARLLGVIP
jgi:hypothetical protein